MGPQVEIHCIRYPVKLLSAGAPVPSATTTWHTPLNNAAVIVDGRATITLTEQPGNPIPSRQLNSRMWSIQNLLNPEVISKGQTR